MRGISNTLMIGYVKYSFDPDLERAGTRVTAWLTTIEPQASRYVIIESLNFPLFFLSLDCKRGVAQPG